MRKNPGRTGFPPELRDAVLATYRERTDLTLPEIAAMHDIAQPTLNLWIRKYNEPIRGTIASSVRAEANPFRAWAIEKATQGWQMSAIANLIGVSRERVRQFVYGVHGITRKTLDSGTARENNVVGSQCPHCQGDLTVKELARQFERERLDTAA